MPRAVQALRLAAAPTFAVLALLNSGAGTEMLCLGAASPLNGMGLMYGLMFVFHLGPWLELRARHRRALR
jgi:hypothetical protein